MSAARAVAAVICVEPISVLLKVDWKELYSVPVIISVKVVSLPWIVTMYVLGSEYVDMRPTSDPFRLLRLLRRWTQTVPPIKRPKKPTPAAEAEAMIVILAD